MTTDTATEPDPVAYVARQLVAMWLHALHTDDDFPPGLTDLGRIVEPITLDSVEVYLSTIVDGALRAFDIIAATVQCEAVAERIEIARVAALNLAAEP